MALDVYGLTKQRDLATLARFLDEYVDRAANADRGGEELMLERLDTPPEKLEWEFEPSLTLAHIVQRGLDHPRRAFVSYLTCLPTYSREGIERAILGFTRDDQLVLGLSVYSGEWETDEAQARAILAHLAKVYKCHCGLILLETPPPLGKVEFCQPAKYLPAVFHTCFEA